MFELAEAYFLGFLSSFTPCVFPLIPITLALFGARQAKSRFEGFILGLSYVLGISLTYTTLGIISAKLGLVFGSFLGKPWVIIAVSIFLFLIVLFTLEIINFKFFSSLQTKASSIGGKGISGAFLMGTASGLVAAPCIGPALVIILSLAAKSQNVLWGASLLFFYSLGLGTIFLILATYSDLINKLPKSGNWLNYIKFILASMLIMVIIFLCQAYINKAFADYHILYNQTILAIFTITSLILAYLSYKKDIKLLKVIACILFALSTYQIYISYYKQVRSANNSEIIWLNDFELALKLSSDQQKPLLVDLYADWCTECKEFEHITFPDKKVQENLKKFVTAKIDFTDTSTEIAERLTEEYDILGLPVILIIKPDGTGKEFKESRITGFIPPEKFTSHISKFIE